jgi:hypothetical protein
MTTNPSRLSFLTRHLIWIAGITAALATGCKPPPSAPPPSAPPATAPSGTAATPVATPEATTAQQATAVNDDGLPAEVIKNYEELIRLTAEYNARAEKITDRQTYSEQSGSLAELENELSNYVQYMESTEATLTAAQRAILDSKYYVRAKPLIDAKRQHKMRLLNLVQ